MSGNNALAAAKRRRVGAITVDKPPQQAPSRAAPPQKPVLTAFNAPLKPQQGNSNQFRQQKAYQQQSQPQSSSQQQSQPQSRNQPQPQTPTQSKYPPQQQTQVHPLQLLTTHDITINKMITEFPQALDALGESFNVLSDNCDNLNERLEKLETTSNKSNTDSEKEGSTSFKNDLNGLLESSSKNKTEIDELKISMVSSLQTLAIELNKNFNSIVNRLEKLESEFAAYNMALKNITSANDALYGLIRKVDMRCNNFDSKLQMVTASVETVNTLSSQVSNQEVQETESSSLPTTISLADNNSDSNIVLVTSEINKLEMVD